MWVFFCRINASLFTMVDSVCPIVLPYISSCAVVLNFCYAICSTIVLALEAMLDPSQSGS